MWRLTPRLAIATLTATLALAFAPAPQADAAAVQSYTYQTYGSVSNQAGVSPIGFEGVNYGMLTTPGTFALGKFDAADILPPTATLTYNNTPFTIDLSVAKGPVNGPNADYYDYLISGTLNGSISGAGASTMVASITSITGPPANWSSALNSPPFPVSDLQVSAPQGINAPNWNTNSDGYTTLYAQVLPDLGPPSPTPEPTSIAVFGAALAGWAIRRRSRLLKAIG